MKLEVIISTMNMCEDKVLNHVQKMNLNHEKMYITIINQVNNNQYSEEMIVQITKNVRVIYSNKIGIGNSRNLGLKYHIKDMDFTCFTDDDVIYNDDFYELLSNEQLFSYNDCVFFNVISKNLERQIKLNTNTHKINKTNIFRYAMYNLISKTNVLNTCDNIHFSNLFRW